MKLGGNNYEFYWIGESFSSQKRESKKHYEAFSIGVIEIKIGDFVLVRNNDALDPEDIITCYVAQVKDLFDTGEEPDPHQAHVQWFSRIPELPHYALKSLKTTEHEQEVIQEKRSTWDDRIDAETIFQKCEIIFLELDADPDLALSKYDDHPFPVFFCRYAFSGKTLVPVVKDDMKFTCVTPSTPQNGKTNGIIPLSDKKHKDYGTPTRNKDNGVIKSLYTAMSIGNPDFPKVLIKRIDDRILESTNKNVRVFVADSTVKSIDDVADKFMKKLKFEKGDVNNDVRNGPIIHTLTPTKVDKVEKQIVDLDFPVNGALTPKSRRSVRNALAIPRSSPRKNTALCSTPEKSSALQKQNMDFTESINNDIIDPNAPINCTQTPKSRRSTSRKSFMNLDHSAKKTATPKSLAPCPSPEKRAKLVAADFSLTRSGRKVKPVNYAENLEEEYRKTTDIASSQKKKLAFVLPSSSDSDSCNFSSAEDSSDSSEISDCSDLDESCKPISKRRSSSVKRKKSKMPSKKAQSPRSHPSLAKKNFDLSIPERKTPLKGPQNVLEESRLRLHVSAVPSSLPCREEEYSDIYSFVKGCLCAQTGGCMYISGVPGTGKTATVHEVIRNLEKEKESEEVPIFTFIEVNGMWMTDPYQCYVQIFKSLTGKTIAPQQAADLLEKRFTERGPKKDAVVLLVDELDRLWTRKQTVMYNIFDWPTKQNSKLVVLAIANTMDLPERMMMNRISSRIGLTRKTFQPYTFKQLQEIIMSRIQGLKVFDPDAVQLVARKVAAVSGDARRALDICRFATEVTVTSKTRKKGTKILIGMEHVDAALQQMFSSPLICAIRSSSKIAKLFFQCLLSEFARSGLEETTLLKVYQQVVACCRFEGCKPPNSSEISSVCTDLATSHLILVDNFRNDLHMKIRLNVSSDDVTYALSLN